MVTPEGEVLHTYEFGEDGSTPLFTKPIRPMQNYNSNVCVINQYQADDKPAGTVCVFYEDGTLKFIYKGKGTGFNPIDISCDSVCNIACISYFDETIDIINSDGMFLKHLLSGIHSVSYPYSLGLHKGVLWVGSENGDVKIYRYEY